MENSLQSLLVHGKRMLTDEICELELRRADGGELPAFDAGSHLNVTTPSGAVRSYSLTNDPVERHRYVIAVKREGGGRGGSVSMVDQAVVGMTLPVAPPANAFQLVQAQRYLFIAGGIGITPLLSMMSTLLREGSSDFQLIYCTRSIAATAYARELSDLKLAEHVTMYHDQGRAEAAFDFWPQLKTPKETQVYCCGPAPLLSHILALTVHWPERLIHFEDFGGVSAVPGTGLPFSVKRAATGETIAVPADKSLLHALQDAGYDIASSCETGTCGTCRTRLVAGEVEHRDLVLTEAERAHFIMPCVSRAAGEELVLDF